MTNSSIPGPGWYTDPSDNSRQKYWDGNNWDHGQGSRLRPPTAFGTGGWGDTPSGAVEAREDPRMTLVICGYIFAVLIPIVGLVLGIVAVAGADRPRTRFHGWFILGLTVLAFILWVSILSSGSSGGDTYTIQYDY